MTADELAAIVEGIVPAVLEKTARTIDGLSVRLAVLEQQAGPRDGRDGAPGRDGLPGPPGEKGKDGVDGKDGQDGQDGLGHDDLEEVYDGERTLVRRYLRAGVVVKEFRHTLTHPLYKGLWLAGHVYARGDCVTRGGSIWHCNVPGTTKTPGDGGSEWTLAVQHGKDRR